MQTGKAVTDATTNTYYLHYLELIGKISRGAI